MDGHPLLIPLKPSRYLRAALFFTGGLAVLAILVCPWSWGVRTILVVLLCMGLWLEQYRLQQPGIQAIAMAGDGWQVLHGGEWRTVQLSANVVVTWCLTVLYIRYGNSRHLAMVVLPDSADPEALRQLRRCLIEQALKQERHPKVPFR